MQRPLSLRAVAVGWLARREHSERELRRKLSIRLQRAGAEQAAEARPASRVVDPHAEVDAVITWLREHGYLDEQRFVESRIHARAARFGTARIQHELSQHGIALDPQAAQSLRRSEYDRALAVRQRRFGSEAPADLRSMARQARFLAGRGFAADVIRRVLRAEADSDTLD